MPAKHSALAILRSGKDVAPIRCVPHRMGIKMVHLQPVHLNN